MMDIYYLGYITALVCWCVGVKITKIATINNLSLVGALWAADRTLTVLNCEKRNNIMRQSNICKED